QPSREVELCGHATLASSYVIQKYIAPEKTELQFRALAGTLRVTRENGLLSLDFPSRPPRPCQIPPKLVGGVAVPPLETYQTRDYLALFSDENTVRNLQPDMTILAEVDMYA